MPRRTIPENLQLWIDARKTYRLSHAQVQMARELGLDPKKLGGKANHRQEPWKLPLPEYIKHLYEKRFGKAQPDHVLSIEDHFKQDQRKRAERSERKRLRRLDAEKKDAESPANQVGGSTLA